MKLIKNISFLPDLVNQGSVRAITIIPCPCDWPVFILFVFVSLLVEDSFQM